MYRYACVRRRTQYGWAGCVSCDGRQGNGSLSPSLAASGVCGRDANVTLKRLLGVGEMQSGWTQSDWALLRRVTGAKRVR